MEKVYQTKFGGYDAPLEEQGNCFQACVSSILEIPLEAAFDVRQYDQKDRGWFDEFNEWLKKYNLGSVYIEAENKEALPVTVPLGFHMAEVESCTLTKGEHHVVVICDYEVVHDPNPNAQGVGNLVGVYLFVALNAAINIYTELQKEIQESNEYYGFDI